MALVGEDERVVGQIFEQGRRRLAGPAAGQIARIVLDAGAGAGRLQHFEIEQWCAARAAAPRAGARAHGAGRGAACSSSLIPLIDCSKRRARRHVMRIGVDFDEFEVLRLLPGQRIELDDRSRSRRRRSRCARRGPRSGPGTLRSCRRARGTAPREKSPACTRLYCSATRSAIELALVDLVADLQREGHRGIGLDRADAVDAGDRGDDDDVVALEQRARRRVAHAVDLLVDRGFLLDIGVGARHVGFGLVIIVIGDEILDRVVGEEALELAVELRGERLVGREDQRRALGRLDHLGHGEGLARAGDAEQHLVALDARATPFDELRDRLRLIALRLEFRYDAKAPMPPSDLSGRGGRCGIHGRSLEIRGSPSVRSFDKASTVAGAPISVSGEGGMTTRRPVCSASGGSKRACGASPKPEDAASVLRAGLSKAARCSSSGFPAGFEALARV